MDEHISIVTPDHIELDFDLAGVGSRFLALVVDGLLIVGIIIVLVIAAALLGFGSGLVLRSAATGSWVLAVAVVAYFMVMWGYFLFFEALNDGQTPGKKLTGIRVVRDNGLPLGWRESALRNLVRVADILPPPACIVGGLAVVLSKTGKRLGDLLAGTVVIVDVAGLEPTERVSRWGTAWILKAERGRSRHGIMVGDVRVDARQIQVIERFLARRTSLPAVQRDTIAWRLASPFLSALGEDSSEVAKRPDKFEVCEQALQKIMALADSTSQLPTDTNVSEDAADAKRRQWRQFNHLIQRFEDGGRRSLWRVAPQELAKIIEDYRAVGCDLARARSMGRSSPVVRHLNNIATRAHGILYGRMLDVTPRRRAAWLQSFPIAVRSHLSAVGLSALLLFGPSFVSFFAVQIHPELGYDLVPAGFLDFEPARRESLHDIPSLARPIAASEILTNNIQVTLLAFAFGLTLGVGTALVLVANGIQLGAIAGWMTAKGRSSALWGWIMPHGGTELLAITLAGAAGFMVARAIVAPGEVRRSVALRRIAVPALIIELGVMVMLIFAGLIEGFVSPSDIGFGARIAVLAASMIFWFGYLGLAGSTLSRTVKSGSVKAGLVLALLLLSSAGPSQAQGVPQRQIVGADISSVQAAEDRGVLYTDKGVQKDILEILKEHGFNYIRLRVFNDPSKATPRDRPYSPQGYCDLTHTIEMARRVKKAGMGLLIDFHYSDSWADPGKQFTPSAWADLSFDDLVKKMHDWTQDAVSQMREAGVEPDMVQIGNEITPGLMTDRGGSVRDWDQLSRLLKAGIAAVKEVDPRILVMLHIDKGGENAATRRWVDAALAHGVLFDVLGESCYPRWQGPPSGWKTNFDDLAPRYPNLLFVIAETGSDGREPAEIMRSLPNHRGLGTFIWEPTLNGNAQSLFDSTGAVVPEKMAIYDEISKPPVR